MKRATYCTLGCKLNQVETDQMSNILSNQGFSSVDPNEKHVDIIVINTCAVTEKASAKSRQLVSRMAKRHPDADIIVAGCSAQMDPSQFEHFPSVKRIVGTSARFNSDWWSDFSDERRIILDKNTDQFDNTLIVDQNRSRPRIKIQDGCDQHCTYCIIPKLRGPNRSVPLENIIKTASRLIDNKVSEIVLTGVRIGSWGSDLPDALHLLDLLQALTSLSGIPRIRLGSVEPWELDENLIQFINSNPHICNHLHVPLQHLHPDIIQSMGRPPLNSTLQLLKNASRDNPKLAIGTDIITGFPGEGEIEFNYLINEINDLPLSYIHSFRFSPRPGTPAASFQNRIAPNTAKERVARLLRINKQKKQKFLTSQINSRLIVIPDKIDTSSQWVRAVTDNFLPLKILSNSVKSGEASQVVVKYDSQIGWIGESI